MKYFTTLAIGLVAAGGNCEKAFRFPIDVNPECEETAATDYLNSIGQAYFDGRPGSDNHLRFRDAYCHSNQSLIDRDASRVKANYCSYQVGSKVQPAVAERTRRQAYAQYLQKKDSAYALKGNVKNNYSLEGQLEQSESAKYKGGDQELDCLDVEGQVKNQFCQSGRQERECQGPLTDKLLDKAALEVASNPSQAVEDKVNDAIKQAIARTISDAVREAFNRGINDWVEV